MKLLKRLFVGVLAVLAFAGMYESAFALPSCGRYALKPDHETYSWKLSKEIGNDSFCCWWSNAYETGQVTYTQYVEAYLVPPPLPYEIECHII